MTLKRASGGTTVDISTTFERKLSGAWVPVDVVKRRNGGSWSTVWTRITSSDANPSSSRVAGTATATYEIRSDGTVYTTNGANTLVFLENWLAFGSTSNYEIKATALSGTPTTGTLDSWVSLGTTRTWTLSQSIPGDATCILSIEIRNAVSLSVVDTATVTLYAERI